MVRCAVVLIIVMLDQIACRAGLTQARAASREMGRAGRGEGGAADGGAA